METLAVILATLLVALIISNLSSGEKAIDYEIAHLYSVGDEEFVRSMGTLLGPAILPGNRTTALYNGDQIFPAMLGAIRAAKKTITFETYIYWSGAIGKEFGAALSERARAGVKVHVLLDWVGSGKMDSSILREMEEAGAEVVKYHPPRWYRLGRFNNRTHRKLLVVDGRIGFTGGVGIADVWSGDAQDPDHWRDSHFQLEGPAVAQMQAAFADNWIETRGLVLHGVDYFPALEPAGNQSAQVFKSSATDGSETIRLMYLLSLSCAANTVRIGNAYFVPDDLAIATLVDAQKRGVTVEIIVPGRHSDTEVVRNASRSRWGPLLDAGVAIYEYRPTMYHTKVMVVDDLWTSVGSTNFDNRSFRLNAEANLNVLDAGFAETEIAAFERDKARSRRITLEMWRSRPWSDKVKDWVAGLARLQL
ncbi:MAG: phospholipase D-like domain-containing protein [Gemmatimonadota bacterium]